MNPSPNPWTFRQEFARTGPNAFVPIQIIGTPQNVDVPVELFLGSLARDFKIAVKAYVQMYANTRGVRVNEQRLENLEIFIFPTSTRNTGNEMRRPSGAVKVNELSTLVFEEVLEQVQSEESGSLFFNI
jgi:hypothetical protein